MTPRILAELHTRSRAAPLYCCCKEEKRGGRRASTSNPLLRITSPSLTMRPEQAIIGPSSTTDPSNGDLSQSSVTSVPVSPDVTKSAIVASSVGDAVATWVSASVNPDTGVSGRTLIEDPRSMDLTDDELFILVEAMDDW